MVKSNKIKALLSLKNKKSIELTNALGLSKPQALTTKYARDSFTSDDLIKLAELTDTKLCFADKETDKIIIEFDKNDIKE